MSRKLALALVAPLLLFACAEEADDGAVEQLDDVATESDASGASGSAALLTSLRGAPDRAAEVGSGRFEMRFAFEAEDGAFDLLAAGGFDGGRMSMEMDYGAMLGAIADQAGEEVPPGFEEPMRFVLDGDTIYLRMPMLDMLTGTSGWLSATPEDLGEQGEALGLSGATTSPTDFLEMLRGVGGDVQEEGSEDVRGVATTRYSATIDPSELLEQLPEEQRAQMEAQLDEMSGLDLDELPVDVWLDDDGLLRRMTLVIDGPLDMGDMGTATVTIEMFDYGDPVEIEIPDPGDVTPMSDALGAFGGLGGYGDVETGS